MAIARGRPQEVYSFKKLVKEKYPEAVCEKQCRSNINAFALYLTKIERKEDKPYIFRFSSWQVWEDAFNKLGIKNPDDDHEI